LTLLSVFRLLGDAIGYVGRAVVRSLVAGAVVDIIIIVALGRREMIFGAVRIVLLVTIRIIVIVSHVYGGTCDITVERPQERQIVTGNWPDFSLSCILCMGLIIKDREKRAVTTNRHRIEKK